MPLSFATPPGASKRLAEIKLPPEIRSAPFLSVWSGSAVHGFDSRLRLGGVFVAPADVVLGLRSWNDAREGVVGASELLGAKQSVPYAIFEVEKIVRMMLHQSGLAFEILASPVVFGLDSPRDERTDAQPFPARRILDAAVTSGLLHHYRDVSRATLTRLVAAKGQGARASDIRDLVRTVLTGNVLMHGEVEFHLPTLLERQATAELGDLIENMLPENFVEPMWLQQFEDCISAAIDVISPDGSPLPPSPTDYDWLHDFVINSRLQEFKSQPAHNQTQESPS